MLVLVLLFLGLELGFLLVEVLHEALSQLFVLQGGEHVVLHFEDLEAQLGEDYFFRHLSKYISVARLERNALYGARIKNTTQKHLLAGPITVIDAGSYAGDANIEDLPPGQERFISYGVDLEVPVIDTAPDSENVIESGKIVKGVLWTSRRMRVTRTYEYENKGTRDKMLVIEHSFHRDWELVGTEKPFEKTEDLYRFKRSLTAGKRGKLSVREELLTGDGIKLLSKPDAEFEWCLKEQAIPKKVKDAVTEVMRMNAAWTETSFRVQQRRREIADIAIEQTRIRENMKTVNQQQSEYYTRLLKKLNDQESEIEKLQADATDLQKRADGEKKAIAEFLENLNVE